MITELKLTTGATRDALYIIKDSKQFKTKNQICKSLIVSVFYQRMSKVLILFFLLWKKKMKYDKRYERGIL